MCSARCRSARRLALRTTPTTSCPRCIASCAIRCAICPPAPKSTIFTGRSCLRRASIASSEYRPAPSSASASAIPKFPSTDSIPLGAENPFFAVHEEHGAEHVAREQERGDAREGAEQQGDTARELEHRDERRGNAPASGTPICVNNPVTPEMPISNTLP